MRCGLVVALAFQLLGCAGQAAVEASTLPKPEPGSPPALVEEQPDMPIGEAPSIVEPTPEPVPADVLPPDGVVGVIDRAGLVLIIDAGLGRLFQRVRVAPELEGGRFVGFRIESIDPAWQEVPLRPGDVIKTVNGQEIERPEQAMAAFERLRGAEELVIDFTREGVPASLRFAIR